MNPLIGKIESLHLDNGLGIFVCPNNKAPIVSFQAWVTTGSANEGELAGSGVSHFLEHMVFKGTKNYSKEDIVMKVDKIGGKMNAYTSYDNTVYYADAPSRGIETAADIIMELVKDPIFPEEEFAKEKDVIMRERAMRSDSPDLVLAENIMRSVFLRSHLRHPIIGYSSKIARLDKKKLHEYHQRKYKPENIFIVVSGDIEPSNIFRLVKEKYDNWENFSYYDTPVPQEPNQTSPRLQKFFFDDPLSRLAIAFQTPSASSHFSPVFDVLSIILGENESSRLTKKIEREKQLSVSIDCSHYSMLGGGVFCASASAEPQKLNFLYEALWEELNALSEDNPPSKHEIERTVKQISSDFIKKLRNIDSIASLVGKSVLCYSDPNYATKYLDTLRELTPEKIALAIREFITPEKSTTVKMLPVELNLSKPTTTPPASKHEKIQLIKIPSLPRLLILPDKTLPLVDIAIITKGGTSLETRSNAGINSLLASCISCGTSKYDEEKIIEILDDNTIDFSANSGKLNVSASLTAPTESFDASIDILREIIASPIFPEKIVNREKQIMLNSIESEMLSPIRAVFELISKIFYETHPYSIGSEECLKSLPTITNQLLREFYSSEYFRAEDTVVAISGDISDKNIQDFQNLLKSISWKNGTSLMPPDPLPLKKIKRVYTFLPREQTIVTLSFPSCGIKSPDRHCLELASLALNGMNSSLFKTIREEKGMAYFTGFSNFKGLSCGHIIIYAGIAANNINKVLELFHSERTKIIHDGALNEEELAAAKEKILFHLCEIRQNPRNYLIDAAMEELYGNGLESFENLGEKFKSISLEQINSVLAKYFSAENYVEAIVTKESKE